MTLLLGLPAAVGRVVLALAAAIGQVTLFAGQVATRAVTPRIYVGETLRQIVSIGYYSLPVVGLTALFTGAALALQLHAGSTRFHAERVVPSVVAIAMVRELGPVIGGLMVAGRVSSAIAAEISAMRVTEQIDALVTLSTDPLRYLVVPRVLAATLALPCLVAVGDVLGVMGGWLVGVSRLGFTGPGYIQATLSFLQTADVASGLVKAAVFGAILSLMGCFHGYHAGRGALGVGRATTHAVVSASVLILLANYMLTEAFF